jgi:hypothetical protein
MKLVTLTGLLALPALGHAASFSDVVCTPVQPDVIMIDGLFDDWHGVQGTSFAGADRKDAAITLRCNTDDALVYLAVDVSDEWLVRRGGGDKKGPEDEIQLELGGLRLTVAPADPDRRIGRKLAGKARGLVVADTRTRTGWAIELAVPRAAIGLGLATPSVRLSARFQDVDMKAATSVDEVVATPPGATLTLAEGDALFKQFLDEQRMKPADVWFDQRADVDGDKGDERIVAAGRTIAVLSDRYAFMQLGVPRKDILEVRLEKLHWNRPGRRSLVVRYVERGAGKDAGSREVLAVWHVSSDGQFTRVLAVEIGKESAQGKLTSTWAVVPTRYAPPTGKKAARKPGCCALRVSLGTVTGFTADTWRERPAEDMVPILLPWAQPQVKAREWVLDGDVANENTVP